MGGEVENKDRKRGADFLVSVTIVVCHWGRPGQATERLAAAPRGANEWQAREAKEGKGKQKEDEKEKPS